MYMVLLQVGTCVAMDRHASLSATESAKPEWIME